MEKPPTKNEKEMILSQSNSIQLDQDKISPFIKLGATTSNILIDILCSLCEQNDASYYSQFVGSIESRQVKYENKVEQNYLHLQLKNIQVITFFVDIKNGPLSQFEIALSLIYQLLLSSLDYIDELQLIVINSTNNEKWSYPYQQKNSKYEDII